MTFKEYVEDKYQTTKPELINSLMELEKHNTNKPKGLTYTIPVVSGRDLYNEHLRLANIATQIRLTHGEVKWHEPWPDKRAVRKVDVNGS